MLLSSFATAIITAGKSGHDGSLSRVTSWHATLRLHNSSAGRATANYVIGGVMITPAVVVHYVVEYRYQSVAGLSLRRTLLLAL